MEHVLLFGTPFWPGIKENREYLCDDIFVLFIPIFYNVEDMRQKGEVKDTVSESHF